MQIWLDTINLETVTDGVRTGVISGVTTNPSILSKTKNVEDTLSKLLEFQPGPVAVQTTSEDMESMVDEGKRLYAFSNRFVIKVPVTKNGLSAMRQLIEHQIPVLGTAILHPSQALLAANLGSAFISPYLSHIADWEVFKTIYAILRTHPYKTKLLAASVKTMDDLINCAVLGTDAVTIKEDLYYQLVAGPTSIEKFSQKFRSDWAETHGHISIKELVTKQ